MNFLRKLLSGDDGQVAAFHVVLIFSIVLFALPLAILCIAALEGWKLPNEFADTVKACGEAFAGVIAACGGAWFLKNKGNGQ